MVTDSGSSCVRKETRNKDAVVRMSGGAPDKKPFCKGKDWESERSRQSLRGLLFSGSCRDRCHTVWGVRWDEVWKERGIVSWQWPCCRRPEAGRGHWWEDSGTGQWLRRGRGGGGRSRARTSSVPGIPAVPCPRSSASPQNVSCPPVQMRRQMPSEGRQRLP